MRTWNLIKDSRDKPCLLLEDSPLWVRLAYRLWKRRFCFLYERKAKIVLVHLSSNKAEEIQKEVPDE